MTEAPAAFRASYADWKIVKGRKVVQVVFELPLEQADNAYQVLGGMPLAASEIWCGIARIQGQAKSDAASPAVAPRQAGSGQASAAADRPRRPFDQLTCGQQAGMLCASEKFRLFLRERFGGAATAEDAAEIVRERCKVTSRSQITPNNPEWSALMLSYRLWEREPEVVG